jgi:hypothetical protein
LDFSDIPPGILAQWYRLALLLKGNPEAAEALLIATCAELAPMLDQLRSEKSQHAFVVMHLRTRCLASPASEDAPPTGVPPLAAAVSEMPEPTRSAVALFYVKVLPLADIAALLNLTVEELGIHLSTGRTMLSELGVAAADSALAAPGS